MGALADLLRPVEHAEFVATFWRRAPMFRAGGHRLAAPDLEPTVCGAVVDSVGYDEDRRRIASTTAAALAELAAGRTVIVNGVHVTWPAADALAAGLSAELGSPVRANLYLTPPHGLGFPVHADRHDVFVLQLAGSKRWLLYAPGGETPSSAPVTRPGDLLYVPCGFPHMAAGGPELSIHATFGVHS